MPFRKRSQARILALQALCLFDGLGEAFTEELDGFLCDAVNQADLGWKRKLGPKLVRFARDLATGAWQNRTRSDELLVRYVPDWSVERMQPVDRSILRLGLYELFECPDTPHQVVINEAVDLARQFGGKESPAFVNGVLDGVRGRMGAPASADGLPDTDDGAAPAPPEPSPGAASTSEEP